MDNLITEKNEMGRPLGSKNQPKDDEQPKRGPGRPRKEESTSEEGSTSNGHRKIKTKKHRHEDTPRRGPGRPRKDESDAPRRGPGRPRKEAKTEEAPRKRSKVKKERKHAKLAKTTKDEPQLVVTSKTKEMIREMGLRCSNDFVAALNHQIAIQIRKAAKRCEGNSRQTLKEVDAI